MQWGCRGVIGARGYPKLQQKASRSKVSTFFLYLIFEFSFSSEAAFTKLDCTLRYLFHARAESSRLPYAPLMNELTVRNYNCQIHLLIYFRSFFLSFFLPFFLFIFWALGLWGCDGFGRGCDGSFLTRNSFLTPAAEKRDDDVAY